MCLSLLPTSVLLRCTDELTITLIDGSDMEILSITSNGEVIVDDIAGTELESVDLSGADGAAVTISERGSSGNAGSDGDDVITITRSWRATHSRWRLIWVIATIPMYQRGSWKAIMNRTNVDPHVLLTLQPLDPASETPLLTTFVLNNAALESIQKSLEEYLECLCRNWYGNH